MSKGPNALSHSSEAKTMNKSFKRPVALLLAVVSAALLPAAALANTTYSGGYGGINDVATTGGNTTNLYSTIGTSSSATLKLVAHAHTIAPGSSTPYTWYVNVQANKIKPTSSLTLSRTYNQVYNSLSSVYPIMGPNDSFAKSYYYDFINGYAVINDALETFI